MNKYIIQIESEANIVDIIKLVNKYEKLGLIKLGSVLKGQNGKEKANDNVEQNKKNINGWVVSLVIAGVVLLLGGLGNWSSDTKPISETKPTEALLGKEQYYYDTFVKGCEKGGATPSECQCVLTKVKQRWTFEEFEAVAIEYAKTDKLPEALGQMATDCLEV